MGAGIFFLFLNNGSTFHFLILNLLQFYTNTLFCISSDTLVKNSKIFQGQ